ncbi:TAT-variant-translocated molybdopterin oxidoreductase [bacterium]|nr:TAT-variant-translocated molybdopterin oxidoreductase [bacterium]
MSLLKNMANNAQSINVDFIDEPKQWKSLDEYAQSPEFEKFLHNEFPEGAAYLEDAVSRRNFIKLIGASLAFAGLSSCRTPKEVIVPYVHDPEGVVPGRAKYYATWFRQGRKAWPILAESSDGRPTKIEGNPLSKRTGKATSAFAQASILSMFDQDRLKTPKHAEKTKSWNEFNQFWAGLSKKHQATSGANLYIVAGATSSPSVTKQKEKLLSQYPKMNWLDYEMFDQVNESAALNGHRAVYDLSKAKVIVSLNSDFMQFGDDSLKMSRDYAKGRKVEDNNNTMNRLYVYETAMTLTGSNADHRLALTYDQVEHFVIALAQRLNIETNNGDSNAVVLTEKGKKHLDALVKDLMANKGESVLLAGTQHSSYIHALVYKINERLGNNGQAVEYVYKGESQSPQATLDEWILQTTGRNDYTVVCIDTNPIYAFAGKEKVQNFFAQAEHKIALSYDLNETQAWAQWQLPLSHDLESWSDAQSLIGEQGVVQPLIEPLFNSKSSLEFLAILNGQQDAYALNLVKQTWANQFGLSSISSTAFEKKWTELLNKGLTMGSSNARRTVGSVSVKRPLNTKKSDVSVYVVPSSSTYDGQYANNAWLQETPDPITKVTWDNPALVSTQLAKKMNLKDGQLLELDVEGRKLRLPVMVVPGTAKDTVVLTLGYGRKIAGCVGKNVGVNVAPLLPIGQYNSGAKLNSVGGEEKIATTQNHGSMEGRPIVRSASLKKFLEHPKFAQEMVEHPPLESLWKEKDYNSGYQWGMSIDLNACIGCTSCAVACQSENNIPVVGKDQVLAGRDMNWMRIDRYFEGSPEDPQVVHQPVMCQHCENAPCEQVCPVNATVHDDEGLNAMVYNRCIGTRYCSNNCPYKVRKFNFLNYTKDTPELQKMAFNPNVTVRTRGVMEKCTFCVQRINEKKFAAKVDGRELKDGEVKTACQEVCPTEAITFGNILDKSSQVVKEKSSPRNYALLAELNTKPRTTYLAKLRNPNPELEGI